MNDKLFSLAFLFLITLAACNSATEKYEKKIDNPLSQTVSADAKDLIGRWDLTCDIDGKSSPSWLEIQQSGYSTLVGRYVGVVGSARPVSEIKLENGKFHFSIPPQWEKGEGYITVEGSLEGEKLKGILTDLDGKAYNYEGVRAPYLNNVQDVRYGDPVDLFNGTDLQGWHITEGLDNWSVEDDVLTSKGAGANIVSDEKFGDFKLEVEFRFPAGSNSGIYLRGRYEVQIEDSPLDQHPDSHLFGGVYGFLSPNEMANLGPDKWQKVEITLTGRIVTVVMNRKQVITREEIPGITGGALDSNEGDPGPIYLQGDHGAVQFRSIKIWKAVE